MKVWRAQEMQERGQYPRPLYQIHSPGDNVSVPRASSPDPVESVRRWMWAGIGAIVGAVLAGVILWVWLS